MKLRVRLRTSSHTSPAQVQYVDVVAFNRYNAWYHDGGDLAVINSSLASEIQSWHDTFQKPVMITEYGAGAIAGLHKVSRGGQSRRRW